MIMDQQVSQSFSDNARACGGRKEDYFGLLFLEKEHSVRHDKALNQIAFGGNDYGLDAFISMREAKRNLYLFQFKYTELYTQFKGSMQRLIDAGIYTIFKSPNEDDTKNQILMQLRSCLIENCSFIDQVCFRFVFTGDPNEAERSMVLDKLREDLENKRFLVEQFFQPRPVRFIVEYRSSTGRLRCVPLRSLRNSPSALIKRFQLRRGVGEVTNTVYATDLSIRNVQIAWISLL